VTVVDANALILGASTVSGTLGVTTSGAITQSGALSVAGVATLAAGAANNITLATATNDFATVAITTGNNVTVVDANALILGASTVSGTLGVTTAGAITQSGALNVAGVATLAAGAANDITLGTATNDFATMAITTGNNVTLVDANAIVLGASNVSGTLAVTTSGAITQSGALTVTGAATLAAGAANNITLATATNDFGTISILSALGLTLVDANAVTFGASTVGAGGVNVTATGITVNGAFTTAAANGAMTFNAGTGTFTTGASGTIAVGSGSLLIESNDIALGANITGIGILTLRPDANTDTMDLASTTGGGWQLNATELAYLQDGFSSITLGRTAGTGMVYVGGTATAAFKDNVVFLTAPTTLGSQGISTTGSATAASLTFNSGITLAGDAGITTGGGDVTLNGTVDGAQALTITAGTGLVNLKAAVGSTTPLASLTVASSGGADFAATVNTTGGISVNAAGALGVHANMTSSSGNIALATTTANGTITQDSGTSITATTGTAGLTSAAGNILLAHLQAGTTATVQAAGAVTDNNGASTNVTATTLNITAGTRIGSTGASNFAASTDALETALTNLSATITGDDGQIAISNTGALTVTSLTLPALGAADGADNTQVRITTTGDLNLSAAAVTSSVDLDDDLGFVTTGGDLILPANGGGFADGSLANSNIALVASGAGKNIGASGAMGATLTIIGDKVQVVSGTSETLAVKANQLDVVINGTGNTLTIGEATGSTGYTVKDLDGDGKSLYAPGGVSVTAANTVTLDNLTTGSGNGQIAVNTTGTAGVVLSGTLTGTSSQSLTINSAGTVTGDATTSLTGLGSMSITAAGIALDKNSTLASTGAISINSSGSVSLGNITTGTGGTGGLTIAKVSGSTATWNLSIQGTINAGGQSVSITAPGAITVGTGGVITNAAAVALTAADAIGSSSAPITVNAASVAVTTQNTGKAVYINNTSTGTASLVATTASGAVNYSQAGGTLNVGTVSLGNANLTIDPPQDVVLTSSVDLGAGVFDSQSTGTFTSNAGATVIAQGGISIVAPAGITIRGNMTATGGAIVVTASNTTADITLADGVTLATTTAAKTGTGNITLTAGHSVNLGAITSGGKANVTATTGSINNNNVVNSTLVNVTSVSTAALSAPIGTIGSMTNPVRVATGDTLTVAPGGKDSNNVSANLTGSAAGSTRTFTVQGTPPGSVWFNGRSWPFSLIDDTNTAVSGTLMAQTQRSAPGGLYPATVGNIQENYSTRSAWRIMEFFPVAPAPITDLLWKTEAGGLTLPAQRLQPEDLAHAKRSSDQRVELEEPVQEKQAGLFNRLFAKLF
ncbi:MAG: S-layer family protein, partial [Magnetococcales bacterium]|nr:S-layer family protein [Magnetococcales bacterium]